MRQALLSIENFACCENASLALDRYLSGFEPEHKLGLLQNVVNTPCPKSYVVAYQHWLDLLHKDSDIILFKGKVIDRMVVGLSGENPLEISLTLNKQYGLPFIPGSALKGLARHYLEHLPSVDQQHKDILFGNTDDSGYVTFFDAWFIPEGNKRPLRKDVMTVHHPKYYMGATTPPSDFDDPNPVQFLSAVGTYLVAVKCCDRDWGDFASKLLQNALSQWGAGGKTSSGYGKMEIEECAPPPPARHPTATLISNISQGNVKNQINSKYSSWDTLADGSPDKLDIAQAYHDKIMESGDSIKWAKKNEKAKIIMAYYEAHKDDK